MFWVKENEYNKLKKKEDKNINLMLISESTFNNVILKKVGVLGITYTQEGKTYFSSFQGIQKVELE